MPPDRCYWPVGFGETSSPTATNTGNRLTAIPEHAPNTFVLVFVVELALGISGTGQRSFNFPAEMPLPPWHEQGIWKNAKGPSTMVVFSIRYKLSYSCCRCFESPVESCSGKRAG